MSRTLSLCLLIASLSLFTACGKKDDETKTAPKAATCETLVEKTISCVKASEKKPLSDDDIAKFTTMIQEECKSSIEIDPKGFEAVLACGVMDSCEDALKCAKNEGKIFKKATKHVRIKKDIADKKFDEHKYFCKDVLENKEENPSPDIIAACKEVIDGLAVQEAALVQEDTKAKKFKDSKHKHSCERVLKGEEPSGDALKTACKDFFTAWTTDLATTITAERDAVTADTKHSSECYTFSSASKTLGGEDAEKKAKLLCEEHTAAIRVAATLQDVDKAIADKKTGSAYSCKFTLEALDKLGSDFAKAKKEVLINKCYIEYGKFTIETDLAKLTKTYCPLSIKNVIKAAT